MKLFLIATIIFASAPLFACGGGGDKDKEDQALTVSAQYLCGGSGCTKPKPEPAPEPQCGGSGCDKDKGETQA